MLIESLGIHEYIIIAIYIEELPVLMFNAHGVNLFARAEALLYDTSGSQILQVCAHKRAPVSRADMMKFGHRVEVVVIAYYHAVVKIGCCRCHE